MFFLNHKEGLHVFQSRDAVVAVYILALQCHCGKSYKRRWQFLCALGKPSPALHTLSLHVYFHVSDPCDKRDVRWSCRYQLILAILKPNKSVGAQIHIDHRNIMLHEKSGYDQNRNSLIYCTDKSTLQGIFTSHRFAFQTSRSMLCKVKISRYRVNEQNNNELQNLLN